MDHGPGERTAGWPGAVRASTAVLLLAACVMAPHISASPPSSSTVPPAGAPSPGPKKATLVTMWTPQSQFAGFYVALEKGMYARHGVDLTILPGGPGISPARLLREGTVDFAVMWLSGAIRERDAGTPLVHLAQVIPRSSMMLVAKRTSGIRTVADMQGKKVGVWDSDLALPPRSLFRQAGVTVREVPQAHTVNLFLRGGIDVASAMWYNEYHTILNTGLDRDELNVFFLQDLGVRFPEDGLYALEGTAAADPALAEAVVRASREGWIYAFDHPEETLDIVVRTMRRAHVPANRVHQRWMLARMRELVHSKEGRAPLGALSEADYSAVAATLLRDGLIRRVPSYAAFTGKSDDRP